MGKKIEAYIGINKTEFDQKLQEANKDIEDFGKDMLKALSFITIATSAAKVMADWWKNTAIGAETTTAALSVARQAINDIMLGQKIQFRDAWEAGKKQAELNYNNVAEAYTEKKLRSEITQLTVKAADHTLSLADRQKALTAAIEKEKKLKEFLIANAKEQLALAKEQFKLQPGNLKAREKVYEKLGELAEAEAIDSWRLMSQYTQTLVEQQQRAKELFEIYSYGSENTLKGLNERLSTLKDELNDINVSDVKAIRLQQEKIKNLETYIKLLEEGKIYKPGEVTIGKVSAPSTGGIGIASAPEGILANAPQTIEKIQEMTFALQVQQDALMILQDSFAELFSFTKTGFQDMINTMLAGFQRLIAEILAKAAVLTLLRVLFPGSALGVGATTELMNMFGSGLFSSGAKASPALSSVVGAGIKGINLTSTIKGKDIMLVARRNG